MAEYTIKVKLSKWRSKEGLLKTLPPYIALASGCEVENISIEESETNIPKTPRERKKI